MTRRQAVAFFLGDAAFLSDPKFRALSRRLPNPDDFNSAVGAFFIALAAARRNGSPTIDVAAETESRFHPDLLAVGLLIETGFRDGPFVAWSSQSPLQVAAGKARAASAERDETGKYQRSPASPAESSSPSRLATVVDPIQPSPPLPSNQLPSNGGVQGGTDALDVYWQLSGTFPAGRTKDWIGEMAAQFGEQTTGDAIAAEWVTGDRGTVLKRAQNRLRAEAEKAGRAEREALAEKAHRQHKPDPTLEGIQRAITERYGPDERVGPGVVKSVPS